MTNTTQAPPTARAVAHGIRPMTGRDPQEEHRTATPLELLFDLTFVVAFANAGNEMAHLVASGHTWAGVAGFCFALFGITWAWINFSWFASAYDTDDWAYRLTTLVQMIGVVVFALGMPQLFRSIEGGEHVDNRILVIGYVIMRVAMLTQWLRAARQCPQRATCLTYAVTIAIAQVGWVILAWADTSLMVFAVCAAVLVGVECLGPLLAERKEGGTPWHAHHIAERYSLLAIIALGEGVVGSVVSLGAAISAGGWDLTAAGVAVASMGLTFAIWWNYFGIDFAGILHARRERSFGFGYGHIPLFGAIAALGGRAAYRRLLPSSPARSRDLLLGHHRRDGRGPRRGRPCPRLRADALRGVVLSLPLTGPAPPGHGGGDHGDHSRDGGDGPRRSADRALPHRALFGARIGRRVV